MQADLTHVHTNMKNDVGRRSPAVSFAYERGWRQGFVAYGFPGESAVAVQWACLQQLTLSGVRHAAGPDRELDMALDYFQPVWGEVCPLLLLVSRA